MCACIQAETHISVFVLGSAHTAVCHSLDGAQDDAQREDDLGENISEDGDSDDNLDYADLDD